MGLICIYFCVILKRLLLKQTSNCSLTFFVAGSTSNLVNFQIGDPANDYQLEVVLRIVDIFGDYEEIVYTLKVINTFVYPSLT